jgi:hypothetical protein
LGEEKQRKTDIPRSTKKERKGETVNEKEGEREEIWS